jgi:hypothetical protein
VTTDGPGSAAAGLPGAQLSVTAKRPCPRMSWGRAGQ